MNPYTYITINEASELLNKKYVTVKAASSRDVFTRVPVTSHQQSLVKEQVMLFKDKKQLKLAALNREELRTWQAINDTVMPVEVTQQNEKQLNLQKHTGTYSLEDAFKAFPNVPQEILVGLAVIGAGAIANQGSGVPQGNPFLKQEPRLAHG